jgi:hypothetical protein
MLRLTVLRIVLGIAALASVLLWLWIIVGLS